MDQVFKNACLILGTNLDYSILAFEWFYPGGLEGDVDVQISITRYRQVEFENRQLPLERFKFV